VEQKPNGASVTVQGEGERAAFCVLAIVAIALSAVGLALYNASFHWSGTVGDSSPLYTSPVGAVTGVVATLAGLLCGSLSRARVRRAGGTVRGAKLATAALIVGGIGLGVAVVAPLGATPS
jgi:hypothetical protein